MTKEVKSSNDRSDGLIGSISGLVVGVLVTSILFVMLSNPVPAFHGTTNAFYAGVAVGGLYQSKDKLDQFKARMLQEACRAITNEDDLKICERVSNVVAGQSSIMYSNGTVTTMTSDLYIGQ